MKTIYISGKITGLDAVDAAIKFEDAEAAVAKRYGHECDLIFNPIRECAHLPKNSPWEHYMKHCISLLLKSDAIYMLPCWKQSRGAQMELQVAAAIGLEIIFAEN